MRQVSAGIETEAKDGITGLGQCQENSLVRLASGIGLNVGEAAIEQTGCPLDRQVFGDINMLTPAVITASGIAFRILVRQHRTLRLQNSPGHNVFGGNQFDFILLPAKFVIN